MKHSTDAIHNIPETMLYTLYMNYRESKKPDGKMRDPRYEEIISNIDYDFSKFDEIPAKESLCIACRSLLFDQITGAYIEKNPDATIISFGSGLDFRFDRLDNGRIQWFDIELPEVVELRKKIFQETDRLRFLPVSALDFSWLDRVPHRENIFFIAEGLFMYFTREQAKDLSIRLLDVFPGSMLLVDVITTWSMENCQASPYSFLRKMSDMWQWTSDGWYEMENWDPRIKVIDEWMPMKLFGHRDPALQEMLSNPEIPDFVKEQIISFIRIGLVQLGENNKYSNRFIREDEVNVFLELLNKL